MSKELAKAVFERDVLVECLTPSAETKSDYIGEQKITIEIINQDEEEDYMTVTIPWTTTKEIMKMILNRANRIMVNEDNYGSFE